MATDRYPEVRHEGGQHQRTCGVNGCERLSIGMAEMVSVHHLDRPRFHMVICAHHADRFFTEVE